MCLFNDRAYFLAFIFVCITGAGALAAVIAALSAFPGLVAVSGISAIGLAPVLDDTTFEVHVNPVWGIFVVVSGSCNLAWSHSYLRQSS